MSSTVFTGAGIELFHWLRLRTAVKLEAKGIRVSRGHKVTPHVRRLLGLRPRASTELVLMEITKRIEEVTTRLQPSDVEYF